MVYHTTPAATPVAVDAFLIVLSTLALTLRFLSRRLSKAGLWLDDWLALAAWPFSTAICLTFFIGAWHGFGRHHGDPTFFLHSLYVDEILYNTGIALTKLSVLAFYWRIFSKTKTLKYCILTVGGFTIAWWIAFTIASVLQCVPIEGYWNPKIEAKCEKKYPFFLGQAIPNIVLDFVLLILPLQPLWKLKMKTSRRIILVFVFVLGYLNPVISILRIVSFIQLGNKTEEDINYNFLSPALWSATEVAIAIFSCSIPSLTYLLRRVTGTSASDSNGKIPGTYHSSGRSRNRKSFESYREGNSFQRLNDDVAALDYLEHGQPQQAKSFSTTTAERETPREVESFDLGQISVRSNFDVAYTAR